MRDSDFGPNGVSLTFMDEADDGVGYVNTVTPGPRTRHAPGEEVSDRVVTNEPLRRRKPAKRRPRILTLLAQAAVILLCLLVVKLVYSAWVHDGPFEDTVTGAPTFLEAHGAAPAASPACSAGKFEVCSHKCAGVPGSSAGLWSACQEVLRAGVRTFDMDAYMSSDGELFVGHPRDEALRIGVPNVENEPAEVLRAGKALGFLQLLDHIVTSLDAVRQVTLEPKGKLKSSFDTIVGMASAIASRRDTLATVGLIIDTYLDAVRLRAMFPRLLLAGAVKDEGRQDDPVEHQICNSVLALSARLTLAEPYNILMPSAKALRLPGCVDVIPLLAARHVKVMVWIVDSETQLAELASSEFSQLVSSVITNAPFVIAPHCSGPPMSTTSPGPVVIVGGGIIGCSIAYFLSERGWGPRVTIVEAVSVAHGASGKAGGFLAKEWSDGRPLEALARLSFDLHEKLAADLPRSSGYRKLTTLSVECRRTGGAHKYIRSSGKPDPSGARRSRFTDAPDWLDGGCVKQATVIGTSENTAQVTPYELTNTLCEVAVSRGAKLMTARVTNVKAEDGKVCCVECHDGSVLPASVVVLAMGPWSGQALKWFPSLRPVTGTRAHSVTMRPKDVTASPVMSHALFLDTVDADGCHQDPEVYPRGDGEVYMCGYADAEPLPDQPCAAPFDAKCCESLRDMAAGLSSWLAPDHVRYEKEQACFLPVSGKAGAASPDHDLPLIGAVPDCEGLYVATAHSCWGILLSTGTGLVLSELIVDGAATSVDLAPFPTTVRK